MISETEIEKLNLMNIIEIKRMRDVLKDYPELITLFDDMILICNKHLYLLRL